MAIRILDFSDSFESATQPSSTGLSLGTANRAVVTDGSGNATVSAITDSEISTLNERLRDEVGVTINDNQAAASDLITMVSTFEHVFISYGITRGAGNMTTGRLIIVNDGTTPFISQLMEVEIGSIGVITFSVDINAGNLRLRYTSDSTGNAGTFKYTLERL